MPAPTISVIIPTFNRLRSLERTLAGLAVQTDLDGAFEVIVVSDGSTDGTDDYLTSGRPPLPVVAATQANGGPATARNHGVALASGPLLVFVDDDTSPDPHLLAAHLARHDHPDDDLVVLGPMNTPPDHQMTPWVAWEQTRLEEQYRDMIEGVYEPTARQFYTGNASVARRHIDAAGGFDPSFRRAEDVELAYRMAAAGVRFVFAAEAIVLHYAERSRSAWLGAAYAYGRNDVLISRDRDQPWLLKAIAREYWTRNRLVRTAARAVLPRRRLAGWVPKALMTAGTATYRAGAARIADAALSGAYNLAYYAGSSEELGSATAFFDLVRSGRTAA